MTMNSELIKTVSFFGHNTSSVKQCSLLDIIVLFTLLMYVIMMLLSYNLDLMCTCDCERQLTLSFEIV